MSHEWLIKLNIFSSSYHIYILFSSAKSAHPPKWPGSFAPITAVICKWSGSFVQMIGVFCANDRGHLAYGNFRSFPLKNFREINHHICQIPVVCANDPGHLGGCALFAEKYSIHIITYVCNPEEGSSCFTEYNIPQGHKWYYWCIIFVDFTNHAIT